VSPAQKLFGRPIQDTIPAHCRSFAHEWQKHGYEIEKQVTKSLQDAQVYYNQHTDGRDEMDYFKFADNRLLRIRWKMILAMFT